MIIIDTSFFISFLNNLDENHERSIKIMKDIIKGIYGSRITIDYVLDEAVTLTWVRFRDKNKVSKIYNLINGEESVFDVKTISNDMLDQAWKIYLKYVDVRKPLSFTDCMLIAIANKMQIKTIVSYDDEFDGILNRIC